MQRRIERMALVIPCRVMSNSSVGQWNRKATSSVAEAECTLKEQDQQGTRKGPATYASLLRRCGDNKALSDGRQIHAHIRAKGLHVNVYLSNLLVQMYGKCGSVEDAKQVFCSIRTPDLFSWNFMIEAYARNGRVAEAFQLYRRMQMEGVKPNKFTFLAVLQASTSLRSLTQGKFIHNSILAAGFQSDITVSTALLNMYGKCGSLSDAHRVFDSIQVKDAVAWTAIIGAYAHNGYGKEALRLFREMELKGIRPTKITFLNTLDACAKMGSLEDGRTIHEQIGACGYESDIAVRNALVTMYGKCGSLMDAQAVFEGTQGRDLISWNAIIGACAEHGHDQKALELLQQMGLEGIKPNRVTFLSALNACAKSASLDNGKVIHTCIIACEFHMDVALRTALVHMYSKCGSLMDAEAVFNEIYEKDLILWTTMISAYARNRHIEEALNLVERMEIGGVKPDGIILLSVLNACSHAALLDMSQQYFVYMSDVYGIIPFDKHYACIIDLLGRLGILDEAEDLVLNMPTQPGPIAWTALLAGCRLHGDMKRGSHVAEYVFEEEPDNISHYISLSNMYAATSRWDHAKKLKSFGSENFE